MTTNLEILNNTLALLNIAEQLILKDAIIYGSWGDAEVNFKDGDAFGFGYCTNDAARAGHFTGRQRSALFRSVYRKLGILGQGCGSNENFYYCNDWWGDGSGDMFFIRGRKDADGKRLYEVFEEWARM